MDDGHPSTHDLHQLMRGELPAERAPAVLRHLLTGCATCRQVTSVYWSIGLELPPLPRDREQRRYDGALDRAFAQVRTPRKR